MIPKIIHYCWLSGEEYPETIKLCISSWRKHLPDYEFILWDINKFDVNSVKYVKQAYEAGKYAFASDYIRLYALYHYGGIYLDSDIEVFKSFDDLLDDAAFTGFENDKDIAAWIFGSEKGNPLFKELLDYYVDKEFVFSNGSYNMIPNVVPVTAILEKHGLIRNNTFQKLDYITVYRRDFFCPMIPNSDYEDCYTSNTHCQHLFNGGWIDTEQRKIINRKHEIEKKWGKIIGKIYYAIQVVRKDGWEAMISQVKVKV